MLFHTLTEGWQKRRVAEQIRALGVLQLKKAVYGLKQAPQAWWKKLHAFLTDLGFKANKSDVCFYGLHLSGVLLLYVNDIIIAASTAELVAHYAKLISKTFRVSSEGPLTSYLGIDIRIDLTRRRVELCMAKFMEKVFQRFKLTVKQSVRSPLPDGIMEALEHAKPANSVFISDFEFREKVGCIMYYITCM